MTPEALVAEQKKLEVSVWIRGVGTQEHFNQMILQVRNHLLTLVTAIVGAAALIIQKDIFIPIGCYSVHVDSFLFTAGLFIILGFYVTEKGYHNLLVGAVKHAAALENQLDPLVSGIKLGQSISAASKAKILFMSLRSAQRIRLFYAILSALFIGAAYVTAQGVPNAGSKLDGAVAPTVKTSSVVPNDPSAGTRALKKFYQSGAYYYLVEEVTTAAEGYVDSHLGGLDRTNAVAVFDVDDTALSTWEILLSGEFTWDATRFKDFISAGRGKRIEPTLRLFQKIKASGVAIVFVTGRSEELRGATEHNLVGEGF